MNERPTVILSAFADEAATRKSLLEQFSSLAAIGLSHYSIRFLDCGAGVKHVMDLTADELENVRALQAEFGMRVTSIGSPIGKVKLKDIDDGTSNRFVPFPTYLRNDVQRACDLAGALQTNLIRGFSFYPPKHEPPAEHLSQAIDQIGQIADASAKHGLLFGLEVEANLVGRTGDLLKHIWEQVRSPSLVLIFDAGNLLSQGYSPDETFQQYLAMKDGLGWIHVKDYRPLATGTQDYVDEEALTDYVCVDPGSGTYARILADLKASLADRHRSMRERGVDGFFLELEPHLKGGGQFGGFSGPDGMGVAARALCTVLDEVGIGYALRDQNGLV